MNSLYAEPVEKPAVPFLPETQAETVPEPSVSRPEVDKSEADAEAGPSSRADDLPLPAKQPADAASKKSLVLCS